MLRRSTRLAVHENTIRDRLAENLDILEPGLTFIDKEFYLDNCFGTNGRIDILAKDEFNNYVIIELKRSNQAARQGIHELFKYLSILSSQLGVSNSSIRAIIVSTEWNELRVPFTEYLKVTPYSTKGIQLFIDEQGSPIASEEISLAPEQFPLCFSPIQKIYFYQNEYERDSSFTKVSNALKTIGVDDHFLISATYIGNDQAVIHPYSIYIVFSSPLLTANKSEEHKIKDRINWDDELDNPDENFLSAIPYSMFPYDSVEIGYPQKLRVMSYDWKLNIAVRNGRFSDNQKLMSNEDLIRNAMFTEGGSSSYLIKMTSPQFNSQWSEFIENIKIITDRNSCWSDIIPKLMDDIKDKDLKAKVSCYIYSLSNTPVTLYGIALKKFEYISNFQLISKEKNGVRYVTSIFNWNGKNIHFSPERYMTSTYGSVPNWMVSQHFDEQFEFDEMAKRKACIGYPLFEIWAPTNGQVEISRLTVNERGYLKRKNVPAVPDNNIYYYRDSNIYFMHDYASFMSQLGLNLP